MVTTVSSSPPGFADQPGGDPVKVAYLNAEWIVGSEIQLGGADYWRLALPGEQLFQHGWDVMFARSIAAAPDGTLQVQDPQGTWHDDREIIVWQRWMGEGTADRIRRAKAVGQVVVNDVDDHYWAFPKSHIAERGSSPDVNSQFNREHYRETVAASSLITVSTAYLERELAGWGPPVRLVRNYADLEFIHPIPPGDFVGWVGGVPWRGKDLQLLCETVVPWLRKRGRFFYHGGHVRGSFSAEEALGYERISTRPVTGIKDYASLWEPLRVALIPIEDSPFGRAKSYVKGLEASLRGIPFIVSDHEEYRALGATRIVREPADWVRHLEELEDPEVALAEGKANAEKALGFDVARHWEKWDAAFREALRVRD